MVESLPRSFLFSNLPTEQVRSRLGLALAAAALWPAYPVFAQIGLGVVYVFFIGSLVILTATTLIAMVLVDRRNHGQPDRPRRAATFLRALVAGTLYGVLAFAACGLLYPAVDVRWAVGWGARGPGWGSMATWVFLGAALGMSLATVFRERCPGAPRLAAIGRGVALGMLAAPAAIDSLGDLHFLMARSVPMPLLTLGWACGCAIGGVLVALLLAHWHELHESRRRTKGT